MTLRFQFAIVALLLGLAQSQVVDRMVAVVNKRVILQSELDQTARVEFLLQGKSVSVMTPADTLATLERLIDRALLDQQIINPSMLDPTPLELAAKIKEVREGIPGASGAEDRWKAVLNSYGLTQQDLEEQLAAEVRITRLIDLRFRGLVRIEKDAVEDYFQKQFLPEIRKRNVKEPALSEVYSRIENILVQDRLDEMQNEWLKTLRAQAHIEKMLAAPAGPAAGSAP